MSTIQTGWTVECDNCSTQLVEEFGQYQDSETETETTANDNGWERSDDGQWLCEDCQESEDEE